MSRERIYASYRVEVENLDGSKQEFTFDSIEKDLKLEKHPMENGLEVSLLQWGFTTLRKFKHRVNTLGLS